MTEWKPLQGVDADALIEIRLQAHNAVQWINRAARGLSKAQPDDSHTNMGWSDKLQALLSHPLGTTGVQLGLAVDRMALVVVSGESLKTQIEISGKTDAQLCDWMESALKEMGEDAGDAMKAPLPYDIPDHRVQKGGTYSLDGLADAAGEMARWVGNADFALSQYAKRHMSIGLGPSPTRCWPHHFDIATLTYLEEGDPETVRSIGVGLSPGDSAYRLPYFYVNPWPTNTLGDLPDLQSLGRWHTEGFISIVLTSDDLQAADDQALAVTNYLEEATRVCLKLLEGA